jgi:multidrug efflux pump subunit AcrB
MSTRALIGIQNKSGKSIRYIYAHNDNYVDGVGITLLDHYKTRQKVFRLISNGNASFVGPRINPRKNRPHTFEYETCQKDVCVFYARERNEVNQQSSIAMTPESFKDPKKNAWIAFFYYIDNNNVWWVSHAGGKFIKLKNHKDIKKILNERKNKQPAISFSVKSKKVVDTSLSVPKHPSVLKNTIQLIIAR